MNNVIEKFVVVRTQDGVQRIGTIYTLPNGTTFNDGFWSWDKFTALIKLTNIKLKQ